MVTSQGNVWIALDKKPKLVMWEAGVRHEVRDIYPVIWIQEYKF